MNKIIKEENLKGTVPYPDNIIIGGETEKEHNKNDVKEFLKDVKKKKTKL